MVNKIAQFEKSSEFYNLIYGKKDSHQEAIYINNFIKKSMNTFNNKKIN